MRSAELVASSDWKDCKILYRKAEVSSRQSSQFFFGEGLNGAVCEKQAVNERRSALMYLKMNNQQTSQQKLDSARTMGGEATLDLCGRYESSSASWRIESPRLMDEICDRVNLIKALERVKANKGSSGIDGMTVEELPKFLKRNWLIIKAKLLAGEYKPKPVRRVEIPKPDGGARKLGIPTVLDRFIQQAILQVLQPHFDKTFSAHSYGFRPQRSAHQAVAQAQSYISDGFRWVVDIDLEKFFDRVNHDKLMSKLAQRISDKRLLKLIRGYLNSGVMENGLVRSTEEGTPQGGPLSPLLSNIVLDELDIELEVRGHKFVRYADDCNIYVKSERAGLRVMNSVSKFISGHLKLKVNQNKSAVARPDRRKFLGFSFTSGRNPRRRIAPQAVKKFKEKVRTLTNRNAGMSFDEMVEKLSSYLCGWHGYFSYCQTPTVLAALDSWVRRRLRSKLWRQWRNPKKRYGELLKLGISKELAAQSAASSLGPWRMSMNPGLHKALTNLFFEEMDLPCLAPT